MTTQTAAEAQIEAQVRKRLASTARARTAQTSSHPFMTFGERTYYAGSLLDQRLTAFRIERDVPLRDKIPRKGFVTLPCGEREVSAAQELLGHRDCRPPRFHRRSAKRAVRLS